MCSWGCCGDGGRLTASSGCIGRVFQMRRKKTNRLQWWMFWAHCKESKKTYDQFLQHIFIHLKRKNGSFLFLSFLPYLKLCTEFPWAMTLLSAKIPDPNHWIKEWITAILSDPLRLKRWWVFRVGLLDDWTTAVHLCWVELHVLWCLCSSLHPWCLSPPATRW